MGNRCCLLPVAHTATTPCPLLLFAGCYDYVHLYVQIGYGTWGKVPIFIPSVFVLEGHGALECQESKHTHTHGRAGIKWLFWVDYAPVPSETSPFLLGSVYRHNIINPEPIIYCLLPPPLSRGFNDIFNGPQRVHSFTVFWHNCCILHHHPV